MTLTNIVKAVGLIKYWGPVVLLVSFIFTVSALPVEPPSEDVFWPFMFLKKITHVFEYGLLFLLSFRAFKKTTSLDRSRLFIWSLILVFSTAMVDEYRQGLVPGGGKPHLTDVMIDLLGAGLAYLIVWRLLPKMPRRLRTLAKILELV